MCACSEDVGGMLDDTKVSSSLIRRYTEAKALKRSILSVRHDRATQKFFASFKAPKVHVEGVPDSILSLCKFLGIHQYEWKEGLNEYQQKNLCKFAELLSYCYCAGGCNLNYLEELAQHFGRLWQALYISTNRLSFNQLYAIPYSLEEKGKPSFSGRGYLNYNVFHEGEYNFSLTLRLVAFNRMYGTAVVQEEANRLLDQFLYTCLGCANLKAPFDQDLYDQGAPNIDDIPKIQTIYRQRADMIKYCMLQSVY
jgi:hypothetical protein